jgi:hypothetical protein
LLHQRFFRHHGHLSALCGHDGTPCLPVQAHFFGAHNTTGKSHSLAPWHPSTVQQRSAATVAQQKLLRLEPTTARDRVELAQHLQTLHPSVSSPPHHAHATKGCRRKRKFCKPRYSMILAQDVHLVDVITLTTRTITLFLYFPVRYLL